MAAIIFFFAHNSGTVRHTGMKFDTYVLEERTNLSYITAAILENGGRDQVFCL
jgi:hypothetical protein